ncbi:alanine dehydrogenase [Sulfurimicrobium lacus]|uniref:Alanine dehydrogenase n=1 Tax=Sulfurimicrobium lacus TaxID=2715678 RepID=A0A6F8VCS9_9PROT|nr:alanine dehydrogenase [Sulfurimicrobium lacus]BCB26951.1 alanine dehydrogenase [Sulfurimicrobium lacus]
MRIGVPKEIKDHEFRVGLTPAGVRALVGAGHEVHVQTGAGSAIGFGDTLYAESGARIVGTATEALACPMIVKVKEPQSAEIPLLHEGQILFTYLHLAADAGLTEQLLQHKIIGIAYETVTDAQGRLPLLTPMSEVAGRIALQAGATSLQMNHGGSGVLLGGVPGVAPGKVVILGAGTVGTEAAKMAMGSGADVTILDLNLNRLRYLDDVFGGRLKTHYSQASAIEALVSDADLVVGSVLIPGKRAPKLISRELVGAMRPGSVLVDVAIDQGGCAETSRPTTHSRPTYVEAGVVHYCVTNMPAACARTSTQALTHATLPYTLKLANLGYREAMRQDAGLQNGLNLHLGQVTHPSVAADLGYDYQPFSA